MKLVFWSKFNLIGKVFSAEKRTLADWKRWIAYRFRLFLDITAASLRHQSVSWHEHWLICDDRLQELSEPLRPLLPDSRFRIIYPSIYLSESRRLADEGVCSFIRIDSDDAYHAKAAADVLAAGGNLRFTRGHVLELRTGRMYEWNQIHSPFHAVVWTREALAMGFRLGRTHARPNASDANVSTQRRFIVSVHDANEITNMRRPWVGRPARVNLANYGIGQALSGIGPIAAVG